MMKRGAIIACVVFLNVLVVAGFLAYRGRHLLLFWSMRKMEKMPDEFKIARVVSGNAAFSKALYHREPDLGVITDIGLSTNHELALVGRRGAAFLSDDGSHSRTVHFDKECDSDVVLSELGDGAFLCRGTWSMGTTLFDSSGKMLWSYGGDAAVDDSVAGDLGAGGAKRVVVGLNGYGGVRLLSSEGKELWKQEDGNVWHVEIAAADERSGNVILHSNVNGRLTVRNATGTVLARYTPEIYLSHFSLTGWNNDPHRNKLIAAEQGSVYVLTMEGKIVVRLHAPGSRRTAEAKGTPVHFSADTTYYASLVRHSLWSRSVLYIYDRQNQLVYDEILDHDCAALHAVPGHNSAEDLLLGCDGNVWKYSRPENH
jgi:hypothetical protein